MIWESKSTIYLDSMFFQCFGATAAVKSLNTCAKSGKLRFKDQTDSLTKEIFGWATSATTYSLYSLWTEENKHASHSLECNGANILPLSWIFVKNGQVFWMWDLVLWSFLLVYLLALQGLWVYYGNMSIKEAAKYFLFFAEIHDTVQLRSSKNDFTTLIPRKDNALKYKK